MYAPIKVIIADDHEIFRDGLKVLLSKQNHLVLVAEAKNGAELVRLVDSLKPDLVITDVKMPAIDGIEASRLIKEKHPEIGIIALSMFDDDDLILKMIAAGASGYLLKNTNKTELINAATTIVKGGTYYSSPTSARVNKLIADKKAIPHRDVPKVTFTAREMEVIKLICEQNTNKEIAGKLHLSARTVESYRVKIQKKTSARNSIGIAIYALKNKIFPF